MENEKGEKTAPQEILESDGHSDIQVGDILHVHATPEQEARVLKKIDRL